MVGPEFGFSDEAQGDVLAMAQLFDLGQSGAGATLGDQHPRQLGGASAQRFAYRMKTEQASHVE